MYIVAVYSAFSGENKMHPTLSADDSSAIIAVILEHYSKEMTDEDVNDWKLKLESVVSTKDLIALLIEYALFVDILKIGR